MRNIYSLLAVVAILAFGKATTAQVLLSEDFETGIPNTWFLINADGLTPDSNVAYVNDAWVGNVDLLDTTNHDAVSTSWYAPAGVANDWLITPPVALTANNFLKWRAVAVDANYPDGYEVRVMIDTGGTPAIANFVANPSLFSITAENSAWTTRQVSLNTYAGQTVRFAFRNHSNDMFLLQVDDVEVGTLPSYDASLDSIAGQEYSIVPKNFIQPLSLGARINNTGANTLNNVKVQATVFDYSTSTTVYADSTSELPTLAAGGSQFLALPSTFTPADTGVYYIQYTTQTSNLDTTTSNDTLFAYLIVDDSTYARDNGQLSGSLGIGGGTGGYLGQTFEVTDTAALTSISMFFNAPTIDDTTRGVVFAYNTGTNQPGAVVAMTPKFVFATDSSQFITLSISGGNKVLLPGKYVVAAQEFDNNLTLGTTKDNFTLGSTWVKFPVDSGTWQNNEHYNFNVSYVLRPNFGVCKLFPDSIASNTPACAGDANGSLQVFISSNNGNLAYTWAQGGTTDNITGLTGGTYAVSATDDYGCYYNDSITLTEPTAITVATDTTDASSATANDGAAVATATGGTSPYTYAWDNGGTTASISGLTAGTYVVTVTDGHGCTTVDSAVVNFAVGINDLNAKIGLQAYPNPAQDQLNVVVALPTEDNINIKLANGVGQVVFEKQVNGTSRFSTTIDVKDLPAGIYLLSVKTQNGVRVEKLMKD